MTTTQYVQSILENSRPLAALPTEVAPKLAQLEGIRAVLFDIYGTLLISASGDIGANSGDHRIEALQETLELFQLSLDCQASSALQLFAAEIAKSHAAAQAQGVDYPEVDIVEIWQAALPLMVQGQVPEVDWRRLALEYEVRVNPVWPMPGVESTLEKLVSGRLVLGIVSNAQFFTPLLFPALLGKTLVELGFDQALSYFSYEHRQAKPGSFLYALAQRQLESQGIRPAEVLYVGNDMLNDVTAAASVGFKTALFAGDRRSLRLRTDDDRVRGIEPDVVITELVQLTECLESLTT
ncbi:MAG: HAD family hydrolase [Bythopirellula sp.]